MENFDLEWFNNKVVNKQIRIESVHTDDGLLGMAVVNLIVNDCEIEIPKYWKGLKLKINDGNIVIYFSDYKQSELEECKHILQMYREGELVVDILLPEGDTWNDDRVIGFPQY